MQENKNQFFVWFGEERIFQFKDGSVWGLRVSRLGCPAVPWVVVECVLDEAVVSLFRLLLEVGDSAAMFDLSHLRVSLFRTSSFTFVRINSPDLPRANFPSV